MHQPALLVLLFSFLPGLQASAAAVELQAPDSAGVDSQIEVRINGEVDPRSFVSVVAPDTPEGRYDDYVYARSAALMVPGPATSGDFEIRLLGAERPYPTLAKRPIRIEMPEVQMEAPEQVPIGTTFEVRWKGPSQSNEYITLVPTTAPDGKYEDYVYARGDGGGSLSLTTPSEPGSYELRYMTGKRNVVIGRRALSVGDLAASLRFPPQIGMGAALPVEWSGPGNPRDYITIVAPDAGPRDYSDYVYTTTPTVSLTAPETPGAWEVRYLTADSSRILARGPLTVVAASASLQAAASVPARGELEVRWSGPGNELDYIAITAVGKPKEYLEYSYTRRGNPVLVRAPATPGEYELHYLTGRTDQSLAAQALRVEAVATPGRLRVLPAGGDGDVSQAAAVELILDASGSMLQKLDGRRRIDIARDAITSLIQRDLAPGTPTALRVFGHRQADACDTELLLPLAPLDRATASATVRGIEAKNLAKTPIADSLAAVASDLAGHRGAAIVILVTDGEETCDGDPAAEIGKLRQHGFEVTLNIVGFAIDEYALQREFQRWASLAGGAYLDATDAASLASSIGAALRPPFGVFRGEQQVASGVAGGEALSLPAGDYTVRIGGRTLPARIESDGETVLQAGLGSND
jgi:Mg-chelatase subunit ChlD